MGFNATALHAKKGNPEREVTTPIQYRRSKARKRKKKVPGEQTGTPWHNTHHLVFRLLRGGWGRGRCFYGTFLVANYA